MAEFGYDSAAISEGKKLYDKTRQVYDFNKQEDDETSEAYADFKTKHESLAGTYSLHRKKAKVIFRKEPEVLKKLELDGSMPGAYVKWLEMVKKFYSTLANDTSLADKLVRLRITQDDITAANTLIGDVEHTRSEYMREKGESQDATEAKNAAFEKLDDWMSEFIAVSRIALEDKPQLMESLGVMVRS
jgi:uncharacterized membrane protein YgaE (UPF0421/DUF939 family)